VILVYGLLIAAIIVTFSVLEGYSPIANLFKCDIFALVVLLPDSAACLFDT